MTTTKRESNKIRQLRAGNANLDTTDRRLLRLLAEDADRSYAELGLLVHLSAPAVHDRVRKLREAGIIKKTVAKIDGALIGCKFLSFLHIETKSLPSLAALKEFSDMADVEEIHSVTGEANAIMKVRTRGSADLERVIEKLEKLDIVRKVKCFVVLSSHVERGPFPEVEL